LGSFRVPTIPDTLRADRTPQFSGLPAVLSVQLQVQLQPSRRPVPPAVIWRDERRHILGSQGRN
jgi:hypothetical protein